MRMDLFFLKMRQNTSYAKKFNRKKFKYNTRVFLSFFFSGELNKKLLLSLFQCTKLEEKKLVATEPNRNAALI